MRKINFTNRKKGKISTFQTPGRRAFPSLAKQRFTAWTSGSSYDFGFLPYAKAMDTDAEYLTNRRKRPDLWNEIIQIFCYYQLFCMLLMFVRYVDDIKNKLSGIPHKRRCIARNHFRLQMGV